MPGERPSAQCRYSKLEVHQPPRRAEKGIDTIPREAVLSTTADDVSVAAATSFTRLASKPWWSTPLEVEPTESGDDDRGGKRAGGYAHGPLAVVYVSICLCDL